MMGQLGRLIADSLVVVLLSSGLVSFGLGLIIFAFQVETWLETSIWPDIQIYNAWVRLGLPRPYEIEWLGAREIALWTLHLHASIGCFLLGLVLLRLGAMAVQWSGYYRVGHGG